VPVRNVQAPEPSAIGTVCAVGLEVPVPPPVAFSVPVTSNFSVLVELEGVTVKLSVFVVLVIKFSVVWLLFGVPFVWSATPLGVKHPVALPLARMPKGAWPEEQVVGLAASVVAVAELPKYCDPETSKVSTLVPVFVGVTVKPTILTVEGFMLTPACEVLLVPFVWNGIVQVDPSVQVWLFTVVAAFARFALGSWPVTPVVRESCPNTG